MEVEVRGLEDLAQVSAALKSAGDKDLKRELYRSLNSATKEVRDDMRAAIPAALPTRGGLAAEVHATTKFSTSTSGGGRNIGVRIRGRGRRNIASMNRGSFRHRVFGSNTWVTQTAGVREGFLDEAFTKDKPHLQQAVIDAIQAVARIVNGKVN